MAADFSLLTEFSKNSKTYLPSVYHTSWHCTTHSPCPGFSPEGFAAHQYLVGAEDWCWAQGRKSCCHDGTEQGAATTRDVLGHRLDTSAIADRRPTSEHLRAILHNHKPSSKIHTVSFCSTVLKMPLLLHLYTSVLATSKPERSIDKHKSFLPYCNLQLLLLLLFQSPMGLGSCDPNAEQANASIKDHLSSSEKAKG